MPASAGSGNALAARPRQTREHGMTDPLKTPLYDLHVELGGKIVPFAGYSLPVQYPLGIMEEHLHCREAAGLFRSLRRGKMAYSLAGWLTGEPGGDMADVESAFDAVTFFEPAGGGDDAPPGCDVQSATAFDIVAELLGDRGREARDVGEDHGLIVVE